MFLLTLSALSAADNNADSDASGEAAEMDTPETDAGDAGETDSDGENDFDNSRASDATRHGIAGLSGIGKAPASIVWNLFSLVWGVAGLLANRILLPGSGKPTLLQVLPSAGIGLIAGFLVARGMAEVIGRFLPGKATRAISRQALFGLTGRVLFTVTETSGRIRVYDERGDLHDNPCRVAAGTPEIPRGRRARVVDVDSRGRLIVEEVAS